MRKLLIWGTGDQGVVTFDCAQAMNIYNGIDFLIIKERKHNRIQDHVVLAEEEANLYHILQSYDEVIVATGDNDIREKKNAILAAHHIPIATIVHPSAIISPFARISKGCTIFANALIHTNAFIGIGCIVNSGAIIEHDCLIESFVNISPNVSMAGHTTVKRKTFLGIGSTVIDHIIIGRQAIIGAGALVIKDVEDFAVVAGVPAVDIKYKTKFS